MKLKTYHAKSVEAALRLARIEMGEQALFLGAEEGDESGPEKRFRATFALAEEDDDPGDKTAAAAEKLERPHWRQFPPRAATAAGAGAGATAAPAVRAKAATDAPGAISLDGVRSEIRELRRMLEQRVATPPTLTPGPLRYSRLALLFDRLTERGVGAAEANELLAPLEERAEAGEGLRALETALRNRMCKGWRVEAGAPADGPRVVALVGPAGAGKTSVTAKLAVRWGTATRRPVRLFSVDQLRVGAVEQLEAYAGLLGATLEIVDAPEKLAGLIRECFSVEPSTLALIDTPGYAPSESDGLERLAAALGEGDGLETHLVLPPGLHPSDLRSAVDRYARLRPAKLLFSHLDETQAPGAAWNAFRRLGIPISYLSDGPRVPDDLRPATAGALVDRILPEEAQES